MINWPEIISQLKTNSGSEVTVNRDRWNLDNPHYEKIFNQWKAADFNMQSIKWINYYPHKDFNISIQDFYKEKLELKGIHRSWISRLDPGCLAPWHWDVDDQEIEYLKEGNILRYTIIIEDFAPGQIFIIEDQHYYSCKEGFIIKWDDYKNWHNGINSSLRPNWMFHILGYE